MITVWLGLPSMVRIVSLLIIGFASSGDHQCCCQITSSGYCQCCISAAVGSHLLGIVSVPSSAAVGCACSVFCQGCTSWLPLGLYFLVLLGLCFLVTTGVPSSGYHRGCILLSFDNLAFLPVVRGVSPTQSGSGALRSVEFRLQRKGEADHSSDTSFPELGLHLLGKDKGLSLQYCSRFIILKCTDVTEAYSFAFQFSGVSSSNIR